MLDLSLIINVFLGVFLYKATMALVEILCLKALSALLSSKVSTRMRRTYPNEIFEKAKEELKTQTLN